MNVLKLLLPIALAALMPHAALAVTGDKAEFKKVAVDVYAFVGKRNDALKDVDPIDTVLSFTENMTLHLGGKTIELIYVDDPYNPGDIAVWLPQSGVMHAGFVGYIDRHPDIRPDYSHGTTAGMLKQLEELSALKPKVMVPAHGPLRDAKDLHALTDYVLS